MIVALYPDDPHEIREHAHGRFRTIDFCCDRQLLRARRLHVDRLARPPAKTAGGLDRRLCVRQRVSDGLMFDNEVNAASPFAAGETQRELKPARISATAKIPTRAAAPVKQAAVRVK